MRRFRVISGGKSQKPPPADTKLSLYRAHSTGAFVKGEATFDGVVFHWYCLERTEPPIPYSTAIAGYELLDEELRRPFERFVDRHFTEDETLALEAYLRDRYGLEMHRERVELPVKDRAFLFEEGSEVIYEFIELSERADYSLPFKVWGYFTLEGRMAVPQFDEGVELVEEVFRKLRFALPVDREHLKSILGEVYRNRGLFVKRVDKKTDG